MGFGWKWVKVDNLRKNLSNCATSENVRTKNKKNKKNKKKNEK